MKRQPLFDWDPETGIATCIIFDKNDQTYVGMAQCHPDDIDMMSEKTGCHIALERAAIYGLQSIRKNELKPELASLKQLYYSMNRSKYFNPKSYEARTLKRQIKIKEEDIRSITNEIYLRKEQLREFINDKDSFYKEVRANRGQEK